MSEEKKRVCFSLLRMMGHLTGVFEKEVMSRLNGTDLKFFESASERCRDAVRRAKRDEEAENKLEFRVEEFS